MKPTEAEKLLGGHATGTLTEAERRILFAAALEHQHIFDALMDEEALRELLADPAAKAQLLAALASPASPKLVPFWRRTGVLGAAASLLVAATAGLAYLRSPNALPTVVAPEAAKEPAPKAGEAPSAAQAPVMVPRRSAPTAPFKSADQPRQEALAPAPPAAPAKLGAPPPAVVAPAQEEPARQAEKADFRRAEARDQLAKKAGPRPGAAAAAEVVSALRNAAPERKPAAQDKAAGGPAGGMSGGVVGGVAGDTASGVAAYAPATAKAKAVAAPVAPAWTLEARPDGSTRVTVSAPRDRAVALLRRGPAGVEVLPIQPLEDRREATVQWRADLRLVAGDVLDLYLLNAPVTEPAKLPETGPVDGFRARIYPVAKD